jgi:O-antigen/teichoic acid export membrane protein
MTDTLTHRTIKNTVYSILGFVWPLILSFVATPIIVRGLGSSRFGFFALLNSTVSLFALLDFGISYTFTKKLSENRQEHNSKELSDIFSTTIILYSILGIFVLLVLLVLPDAFKYLFKIPEGYLSSYTLAFFIVGLVFLIKMISIPLALIPYSLQRLDIPTKISFVSNTILQIGSIVAIKTGHGIMSLLIVQLFSAIFLLITFYFLWKKMAPDLKFSFVFKKSVVKVIGKQGFWVFLSGTMGNILAQFDKFVLGAIWGPVAVGYYSTAQMLPEKISATAFSLSHGFFPVFSEASSKAEGSQRLKIIFRRTLRIITTITAGLTVLVLIFGYLFINYWISKDFADHTLYAVQFLALTYFLLAFNSFFNSFLSGLNALKFLALSALITAGVDVVFMFLLIPKYGINGAAFAYLLSGIPILFILFYIEQKYLSSTKADILNFYGKVFFQVLVVSGLVYLLAKIFILPFVSSLFLLMLFGAVVFALYLLLIWLFGFYAPEDFVIVKTYFHRFINIFK